MYLFDKQDQEYKNTVLPPDIEKRLAIEAGIEMPWYKYVGFKGRIIAVNRMGLSGKAEDVGEYFGLTPQNIYAKAKEMLKQ
jgi:transketolase